MRYYPLSLSILPLQIELANVPYVEEPTGPIIHGLGIYKVVERSELTVNSTGRIIRFELNQYPLLKMAVEELLIHLEGGEIFQIMINRLAPNGAIDKHTDGAIPGSPERWHLPIFTNSQVKYWDEINRIQDLLIGVWYGPIPYRQSHTVANFGNTPRVHVIADILATIDPDNYPECLACQEPNKYDDHIH